MTEDNTGDFLAMWDAYSREPEPVSAPPPKVSGNGVHLNGQAHPYAVAALTRECDAIAVMAPESGRNTALNDAAFRMGRHVGAGSIDQHTVRDALEQAAQRCGLPQHEIDSVLRDNHNGGLTTGQAHPRPVPPRAEPPAVTTLDDDLAPAEAEDLAILAHARLVAHEKALLRARREAKKAIDAEEALATFREPPSRLTLTDELLIPDEPVPYTIDALLPTGSNALLTAQYKSGKTTLINQLAKSWADDEPFLGKFPVDHRAGRIALWNYELDERMYRRWLREVGICETDRVAVLNLRGYRMPITVPHVEDWIVDWLQKREVNMWVVDPFARAFVGAGKSENDNTEVGAFLDTLDVIKNRAGVSDLILPTHTGRAEMEQGEERARGATRLDDWADVRWLLTQDDNDIRYLRASGRDVEVPEEKLEYDEESRRLTFGGGDRSWERRRRLEDTVIAAIRETPGISLRALRTAVRGLVKGASNDSIDDAIAAAEHHHSIRIERGAAGSASRHFVTDVTTIGES